MSEISSSNFIKHIDSAKNKFPFNFALRYLVNQIVQTSMQNVDITIHGKPTFLFHHKSKCGMEVANVPIFATSQPLTICHWPCARCYRPFPRCYRPFVWCYRPLVMLPSISAKDATDHLRCYWRSTKKKCAEPPFLHKCLHLRLVSVLFWRDGGKKNIENGKPGWTGTSLQEGFVLIWENIRYFD